MRDAQETTTATTARSKPGELPPIIVVELERPAPTPIELTFRPAVDPVAPVYVVIPAMGMRASFYAPLLDELAGAGVGAAVMELRGHQRRPAPAPSRRADHGYADLAQDLGAAIAAIRRLRPGARVLALGHSLGGQVAVVHSALHPDRSDVAAPDALALVGSGSVAWRTWRGGSPYHLLRTQAAGALTRACGHFPGDRVGFAGREAPTQMTEWARWARTGRLVVGPARVDVDSRVHEIRRPVLAVSLAHDPLSPSTAVDGLVRGLVNAPVTREHHALSVARPHFDWVRQPGALHDRLVGWTTESARIPVS